MLQLPLHRFKSKSVSIRIKMSLDHMAQPTIVLELIPLNDIQIQGLRPYIVAILAVS